MAIYMSHSLWTVPQCGEAGEEKPPYNPGELESCDDADSDLVLLVLGGEQASTNLGSTQYLATMPVTVGVVQSMCDTADYG